MKKKIILDCDPGIDDLLAIALCCSSNEIELRGVTVTHGNVPLNQTLDNALALLSFLGRDVEVYAGAIRPLVRSPIDASNVHGNNGLGESGCLRIIASQMPRARLNSLSTR